VEPQVPPSPYRHAYRFQFFIPRKYNPDAFGRQDRIRQATFNALRRRLLARFPGMNASRARPPSVEGVWLDTTATPPEPMDDDCYLYDVVVEPNEEVRQFFVELLSEFLKEPDQGELGLGQKAVLLIFSRVEILYLEQGQQQPQ
jgi:hypothetical protein